MSGDGSGPDRDPPADDPDPDDHSQGSDADQTDAPGTEAFDPAPADDAPLSDLARQVADRREQEAGGAADAPTEGIDPEGPEVRAPDEAGPFEQMSIEEIDEETLWSSLEADVDDDVAEVGPVSGVDSLGVATGAEETDVSKKKYCQSCPYLDDPPALSCTHEGTEIVEVVDSETFRVRNCPIVAESVVDDPAVDE